MLWPLQSPDLNPIEILLLHIQHQQRPKVLLGSRPKSRTISQGLYVRRDSLTFTTTELLGHSRMQGGR